MSNVLVGNTMRSLKIADALNNICSFLWEACRLVLDEIRLGRAITKEAAQSHMADFGRPRPSSSRSHIFCIEFRRLGCIRFGESSVPDLGACGLM